MREAYGHWGVPLFDNQLMWDINYSDILTELIQYAGRYWESYASDLFIIWKCCVEDKLKDRDLESFSITFGFKEFGVDQDTSTDTERIVVAKNRKNNSYYYRKVAKLDIIIDGSNITMRLD